MDESHDVPDDVGEIALGGPLADSFDAVADEPAPLSEQVPNHAPDVAEATR
jgi:hypothetical protein